MLFAIVYYYPPPKSPTLPTLLSTHNPTIKGFIILTTLLSVLTILYQYSNWTLEDISPPSVPWNHLLKKTKPTYDMPSSYGLHIYVDPKIILPAYFYVFTALQLRSMYYFMYRMPTVFIQQCLTKNLLNPSIVLALLVHGTYFNLLYCNRLYYFDGVQLYQTYNALGNFIRTIEKTLISSLYGNLSPQSQDQAILPPHRFVAGRSGSPPYRSVRPYGPCLGTIRRPRHGNRTVRFRDIRVCEKQSLLGRFSSF